MDAIDLVDVVLAAGLLALAVWCIGASLSHRVRADDDGLHVRGGWWRTRTVPWVEVADIAPRRQRSRSRSPLVIETRAGRRVTTGLRAVDHISLVEHWRERTGRASVPAA